MLLHLHTILLSKLCMEGRQDKVAFKSPLTYQLDKWQNTFTTIKYLPRLGFEQGGQFSATNLTLCNAID